ncbi:hypothetical protein PYCCODRAFT_479030 [Trametes coccinea BRFM310]|uniref:Protein kinase domain-containing protein n=1 Tax=Trametes coccinea (strain BRFM310) TaxID=1353009 RepID=A0A1Y2IL18_TRAC3|nr:hypothetical protein PYCCODRAFT_479030 [Trametes coccinea BRFM310]
MFPRGFHPIVKVLLPDVVSGPAPVISHTSVPVHYYYIDFGISTWFTGSDAPRLVVGTLGLDREPPELSDTVPYGLFKLDVFLIGNLIRRELHANFSNLTILEPLMSRMVESDPAKRPTAAEAYRDFKTLRRGVSDLSKYRILQPCDWPSRRCILAALRHIPLDSLNLDFVSFAVLDTRYYAAAGVVRLLDSTPPVTIV